MALPALPIHSPSTHKLTNSPLAAPHGHCPWNSKKKSWKNCVVHCFFVITFLPVCKHTSVSRRLEFPRTSTFRAAPTRGNSWNIFRRNISPIFRAVSSSELHSDNWPFFVCVCVCVCECWAPFAIVWRIIFPFIRRMEFAVSPGHVQVRYISRRICLFWVEKC